MSYLSAAQPTDQVEDNIVIFLVVVCGRDYFPATHEQLKGVHQGSIFYIFVSKRGASRVHLLHFCLKKGCIKGPSFTFLSQKGVHQGSIFYILSQKETHQGSIFYFVQMTTKARAADQ